MKVNYAQNVLKVETGIKEDTYKKGIASLKAHDKNGDQVFAVAVAKDGKGAISNYGLTCNAVIDGELAVVMVLPMGTTMEDVQKQYGQALVTAEKYVAQIAEEAKAQENAIAAIFGETQAE